MRRALVLLPLSALFVLGACVPSPANAVGAGNGTAAAPMDWVQDMLGRVNSLRAGAGVGPLQLCDSLMRSAQSHAVDQALHDRMSHTGSDGSSMVQRVEGAGYVGWRAVGENVAGGQPDVATVMDAWWGSNGHRANLLSGSFEHVGLGSSTAADGTIYWTQDFGSNGSC